MTSDKCAIRNSQFAIRLGWLAIIAALCLPAVWPLTTAPFFASADGLLHLYRLDALDDALKQGVLYPRLFPSLAFGYGQAVFNYYGPLSYYVAELFHGLGASFPDALKWTFALGYVAAGWAAFALARQFVSAAPALLGAVVYVYFPYHLVETYLRGALAEHLAFVFLPLVLWGVTPSPPSPLPNWERGAGVRVSARSLVFIMSLAALMLTHSLTIMIFLPFVIIYFIVMSWDLGFGILRLRSGQVWDFVQRHILRFTFHVSLALGLTAFYWLPITLQTRWVLLSAGLGNEGYRRHLAPLHEFLQPTPIYQYWPHQIVAADHPLGLVSLTLLLITLAAALHGWQRRAPWLPPLLLFVGLNLAALFMQLDWSAPVWQLFYFPLSFLQYPLRFLTLAALGLALSAAILFRQRSWLALAPIPLLIVVAVGALPLDPLAEAASDAQASWQWDFKERQIGATWTAEYMPWWVRADRTAVPAPRRNAVSEVSLPTPEISLVDAGSAPTPAETSYTARRYRLFAPLPSDGLCTPLTVRFHQFYLPQWRVTLGGKPLQTFPSTDFGLLSADLPPLSCMTGEGPGVGATLELDFGMSDIEQLALFISLASLAAILWHWRGRWLLAVAALLLPIGLLFAAQRIQPAPAIQAAIGTQLEDAAELVAVRFDRGSYRAGDTARVTLTWLARRETRENFKGFVHLMDAGGARVIAQSDGDPGGGFTPSSQWRLGEVIEDTRILQIPSDTAPGTLRLFAGLYRSQPLKNLTATRDGQPVPDGRIPIGAIQVVAR